MTWGTQGQQYAMVLAPKFVGLASTIGSASILRSLWKRRRQRQLGLNPGLRFLAGLSLFDLTSSFSIGVLTTWPQPSGPEYPFQLWNLGNVATCNAQGMAQQWGGLSSMFYTLWLTVYYVVCVRKITTISIFASKFEPIMHVVAIGIGAVTAATSLSLDLYNPLPYSWCWIAPFPIPCTQSYTITDEEESSDCIRGDNAALLRQWFFNFPLIFVLMSICLGMVFIYFGVKDLPVCQASLRLQRFARQGAMYAVACCVNWLGVISVIIYLYVTGKPRAPFWLAVSAATISQGQGFLNALFYFGSTNYPMEQDTSTNRGGHDIDANSSQKASSSNYHSSFLSSRSSAHVTSPSRLHGTTQPIAVREVSNFSEQATLSTSFVADDVGDDITLPATAPEDDEQPEPNNIEVQQALENVLNLVRESNAESVVSSEETVLSVETSIQRLGGVTEALISVRSFIDNLNRMGALPNQPTGGTILPPMPSFNRQPTTMNTTSAPVGCQPPPAFVSPSPILTLPTITANRSAVNQERLPHVLDLIDRALDIVADLESTASTVASSTVLAEEGRSIVSERAAVSIISSDLEATLRDAVDELNSLFSRTSRATDPASRSGSAVGVTATTRVPSVVLNNDSSTRRVEVSMLSSTILDDENQVQEENEEN